MHGGYTMGAEPKSPRGDLSKPAQSNVRGPPVGPRQYGPINERLHGECPRCTAPYAKKKAELTLLFAADRVKEYYDA